MKRRPLRRGLSLIEVLTVMAIGSALMAMAVGLVITVHRAGQAASQRVVHSAQLESLVEQFRTDVHAAVAADVAQDGTALTLHLPGVAVVDYALIQGRLQVTRRHGNTVRGRLTLLAGKVRFEADAAAGTTMVVLRLAPAAAGATAPAVATRRIEAIVAADHRYERSPGA